MTKKKSSTETNVVELVLTPQEPEKIEEPEVIEIEQDIHEKEQEVTEEIIQEQELEVHNEEHETEKADDVPEDFDPSEVAGMSMEQAIEYLCKRLNIEILEPTKTERKKVTGLAGFRQYKSKSDFVKNCPEWLKPAQIKAILKFTRVTTVYVMEEKPFAIVKCGNVYHVMDLTSDTKEEKESLDDCVAWITEHEKVENVE